MKIQITGVLLLILGIAGCNRESAFNDFPLNIYNDCEQLDGSIDKIRSNEESYSGSYSIKLNEKQPYGFTYTSTEILPGSIINISVWVKGSYRKGSIVVSSDKSSFYIQEQRILETGQHGWNKISLNAKIIGPQKGDLVKCYVYHQGDKPVYFDDFKLKIHNPPVHKNQLSINIAEVDLDTLKSFAKAAYSNGVISKKYKKYFKAEIEFMGQKIPVKLRLKGDWTDHLEGNKWSLRVKVDKAYSFLGKKTFSLQNPNTRDFLNEWCAHKLYENEGLLTTRYSFIPVKLNGMEMGVYAIEEHFTKQLLESSKRREGPILKYDEEPFWEFVQFRNSNDNPNINAPFYEASLVTAFQKKRLLKDSTLSNQFEEGRNLMDLYKNFHEDIEDIFDIQTLAKTYAISDLIGRWHSLRWHNQRHYYNPVCNKLEPILFDAFSVLNAQYNNGNSFFFQKENTEIISENYINYYLFNNKNFREAYFKQLERLSNSDYLTSFFEDNKVIIDSLQNIINKDFPSYEFEAGYLVDRAEKIRDEIEAFKLEVNSGKYQYKLKAVSPNIKEGTPPLKGINLYAYSHKMAGNTAQFKIHLENFHFKDIEVISWKSKKTDSIYMLKEPIVLKAFNTHADHQVVFTENRPSKFIFRVVGEPNTEYKGSLIKWEKPEGILSHPETSLRDLKKYATISGDKILFNRSIITINKHLVIPGGYSVEIAKGTTINLINDAAIISYSSIAAIGSKSDQIKIISADSSGQGFVVLGANPSTFSYVNFSNLSSLSYGNWNLTGAITFYESDAQINHCTFSSNYCEDALNFIRNKFELTNCKFDNVKSDALDGDFTQGIVSRCVFENIGNDAIDFSGSVVTIENTEILQAGDKGVSGGEASTLTVRDCHIQNSNIGLASKDQSSLTLIGTKVEKCNVFFASFKKKPEYGGASMVIDNEDISKEKSIVGKHSSVRFGETEIKGEHEIDIDSMYRAYNK